MLKMTDSFKKHLSKITFAKNRTMEIFASNKVAMDSLSRAWEMLFDSLCATNDGSIGELKDISSVIQKLSSSQQKILATELIHLKHAKLAELDEQKAKLESAYANLQKKKLPSAIVNLVEDQLSLL